jgi:hypothetical protein
MNYRYGKPKEMQQIDVTTKVNIPVIDFAQPNPIDITHKEVKDERIEANRNEEQSRTTGDDSSSMPREN